MPLIQHDQGHVLQRYTWRALLGSCVPIIMAAYYVVTWTLYLRDPESPSGISFGLAGSRTVYYSWFILGVIGLDLSEYGLLGVEASMLMTAFWGAPNAWHVILHGDHGWNGPEGWLEAVKNHFQNAARTQRRANLQHTPRQLWWVLAAPSIVLFIGLPLSGLSMELTVGFRETGTSPTMTGRNWANFNDRSSQVTLAVAHSAWSLATPPRVPAFGMVFGDEATDSDNNIFRYFSARDNELQADQGAEDIFLAPQTDAPFTGKAWGMVVRYNCTVVQELEDFKILSRRNGSVPLREPMAFYDVNEYRIEIRNQSMDQSSALNYGAVAELAYSEELYGGYGFSSQNATQCYFNKSEGATVGYPGLTHNNTLEMALWQTATDDNPLVYPPLDPSVYNFTLNSSTIAGLSGAYKMPHRDRKRMVPMEAIGVQCISSSAVGTAQVNGVTSRYSNFEPSDTPITQNVFQCAPRLSLAVPQFIFNGDMVTKTWSEDFFTAADAPRSILTPMSGDNAVFALVRPTLLQAVELRRALVRAYGAAAVQLMYDGPQGYQLGRATYDGTNFTNENATGYRLAPVLVRGPIPPALPGILLIIWALISCFLSVWFGFLRRWADTLDSFSLFQFGGDLSDQFKVKDMPMYSFKDFRDDKKLKELPGLVGDLRPQFNPGHITLVRREGANEAKKTKKFV